MRQFPAPLGVALALFVACATAVSPPQPAFTIADIGTGVAEPANCTFSGGSSTGSSESSWLEITQIMNFTQYKNKAGADLSLMPDPVPFPFTLSASDYRAPGWIDTCISRSPTAPTDCEGDECNVYIDEWGIEWVEFALLNCYGSYPTPGVNFFTNPTPAPGNVALAVTQACKNYLYGPSENFDYFYSVTDQWGNKWAMQTTHENITTEAEFDQLLAQVVWPQGWSVEKVPLNDSMIHTPFMVGDACYAFVLKDSLFNSWHLYDYPADGLSKNTLLGAMGDTCERLDAQYTMAGMGGMAPAPAPAATTSAAVPTAGAPAMLLAAMAAIALLF